MRQCTKILSFPRGFLRSESSASKLPPGREIYWVTTTEKLGEYDIRLLYWFFLFCKRFFTLINSRKNYKKSAYKYKSIKYKRIMFNIVSIECYLFFEAIFLSSVYLGHASYSRFYYQYLFIFFIIECYFSWLVWSGSYERHFSPKHVIQLRKFI